MVVSKISSCFWVFCSRLRFFAVILVQLLGVANYFQGFRCGARRGNSFAKESRFSQKFRRKILVFVKLSLRFAERCRKKLV